MMPSRGLDGTCYGDSGGGRFIKQGDEWVLVGLTSWGDVPCRATDKVARVDTVSALNFLNNVLATFELDQTCDDD
jgi:secreted trypsin-like serine protease